MIETIQTANHLLGIGAFFGIALAAVLFIDLISQRRLARYVERFGFAFALTLALFGTVVALVYSEIFGIIPCGLCWLGRVALFPQVVMLATALYFKDYTIARSGIALSVFGFVVSLYHHYIQMGGSEFVTCPKAGADCAMRFMFEFGFVTFPLLGAVSFALLIVLYTYVLNVRHSH